MSKLAPTDITRLIEVLHQIEEGISDLEAQAISMLMTDPDLVLRDVLRMLGMIKAAQSETIDLRPLPPRTEPEPLPPGAGEVIGKAASLEDRAMCIFALCGQAKGWHARSPAISA